VLVRHAKTEDHDAIWRILKPVIRAGETYPLPRHMTQAEAIAFWTGRDCETFVAEEEGRLLGTYYMHANQLGGGAHVANCGYMMASDAAGRGVGRQMCEHSLEYARSRGWL
jgi:L-amino acid N-acyltransferase YncA